MSSDLHNSECQYFCYDDKEGIKLTKTKYYCDQTSLMLLIKDNLLVGIVTVLLNNLSVLATELINLGRSETSGGHSVFKQDIKLSVCTSLGLRKSKVCPDSKEETETGPEKSGFWAPVPSIDSKLIWYKK